MDEGGDLTLPTFVEVTEKRKANCPPPPKEAQWRTPTAEAMGTGDHMEVATDKDGNAPKVGHRVYNKNGKLMAIDLNRQVEILSSAETAGSETPQDGSEPPVSSAGKNWPTPSSMDGHRAGKEDDPEAWRISAAKQAEKGQDKQYPLNIAVKDPKNWPTEDKHKDRIAPDHKEDRLCKQKWEKAEKEGMPIPETVQRLRSQVTMTEKKDKNWPTAQVSDANQRQSLGTASHKRQLEKGQLANAALESTQEPETLWRTPTEAETHNQQTSNQIYLQNQVGATPKKGGQWATPNAGDGKAGMSLGRVQKSLGQDVSREIQWATPAARDFKGARGVEAQERKGNPQDTLPNQLETCTDQQQKDARTEKKKAWTTPNASADPHGMGSVKSIEVNGKEMQLHHQVRVQAGNTDKGSPKLNPRWVETLMGLPLGKTPMAPYPINTRGLI